MTAAGRTIPVREGEALPVPRLEAFLRARLPDLPEGPLTVSQFPTGSSNLTYLLEVDGWRAVLRRPPLGPVPPRAHDMVREARVTGFLHPHFPLAPRPLVVADDPSIVGAPFHVSEYRDGVVLARGLPSGTPATPALGRAMAEAIIETLVQLHQVDPGATGLGEIGRPAGFLERQVRGWIRRWEGARTEPDPHVGPFADWLLTHLPESPSPTVIHNDYHVKNLLFAEVDPARIVAVLDWEMATIGDPLLDLAVALGYWLEPDDPPWLAGFLSPLTTAPGFPGRRELAELYARKSGRSTAALAWYLPFAYFKLAVVLQQIYARWIRGQTRDPRFEGMGATVQALLGHARALARTGGAP